MYLLSKCEMYLQAAHRNTKSAHKVNFKVPNRITHSYEHSPYYIGTKLWDSLNAEVQKADNVFVFKNEISKLHKVHKNII